MRLMKMENVSIVENNYKLIEDNVIKLNENYLWCEPLLTELDVSETKRYLTLSKIPYVLAKFDTVLEIGGDPHGEYNEHRYARVTGLFVRKSDMFKGEDEA